MTVLSDMPGEQKGLMSEAGQTELFRFYGMEMGESFRGRGLLQRTASFGGALHEKGVLENIC